jgi:hypothetical protein
MKLFNKNKVFAVAMLCFFGSLLPAACPVTCPTGLTGPRFCNLSVSGPLSAGSLCVQGNEQVGGNLTVCGTETISNTGASTGCTNGALVVAGGVGIGGNLNVCGIISASGISGLTGPSGIFGAAEFSQLIQPPNNSVAPYSTAGLPASAVAFTFANTIFNSMPLTITTATMPSGQGTAFTLSAPGTYILDYEMSLTSDGSIGLYTGATASSLALDSDSIAGSATGTTWIHGRAIEVVGTTPLVVAVGSVVGTAAVTTAGSAAGFYIVRLTILKVS